MAVTPASETLPAGNREGLRVGGRGRSPHTRFSGPVVCLGGAGSFLCEEFGEGNATAVIGCWAIAGPIVGALVAYYFGHRRKDTA
jgi:hypothetical protein